jgi:hypothetical protein
MQLEQEVKYILREKKKENTIIIIIISVATVVVILNLNTIKTFEY